LGEEVGISREGGGMKEGGQEARPRECGGPHGGDGRAGPDGVLRIPVRELVALQVAPDIVVGVEFRTVGWQVVDGDARTLDEESPGCSRGVRAQAVPNQTDRTVNVSEQVAWVSEQALAWV